MCENWGRKACDPCDPNTQGAEENGKHPEKGKPEKPENPYAERGLCVVQQPENLSGKQVFLSVAGMPNVVGVGGFEQGCAHPAYPPLHTSNLR